tara:strand:- start:182 stop:676 length:495 start_codon:yes stop_codon:yes gene_type:complete
MAAGNTYEPISSTTLGSSQTNLTFSSIPGTYTDLIIIYQAKSSTTGFDAYMRFNADAGANYSATYASGNGSAGESGRQANNTGILLDNYGAVFTTAFNMTRINVMNYANTTTYKTALMRSDYAASGTDMIVGMWRNTAAITSITIVGSSFATGSTFTLYGITAA